MAPRSTRFLPFVGWGALLLAGIGLAAWWRLQPGAPAMSPPAHAEPAVVAAPTKVETIGATSIPLPAAAAASGAGFDVAALLVGPRDDVGTASSGGLPAPYSAQLRLSWDGLTEAEREAGVLAAMVSNIRHRDYAGAESCRDCHRENYEKWTHHAHRLMNAEATDETVLGHFNDGPPMAYLGGTARFYQEAGQRFMKLERGDVRRTYRVTRTIGSRFTQYYVGLLEDGPEPGDHKSRSVEQVLPLGWWIDREEWIPVVNVDKEGPDGTRWDAMADVSDIAYDQSCSVCHTTPTTGDWLLNPNGIMRTGYHAPAKVDFDVRGYLQENHPDLVTAHLSGPPAGDAERKAIVSHIQSQNVRQTAVNLGISCENCHNGSAEHVHASDQFKSAILPHFFPVSSNVVVHAKNPGSVHSRNPNSVNFVCARCHTGSRPLYAGGMATWNSVEFSDAEAGYCYIRKRDQHPELEILACTACHDPHEAIGPAWTKTPDHDDAACLKCHTKYEPAAARFRHTRHQGGTEGARCLNCHMPRINEGMQDVVRTHAIFNPTWPSMIEANHPNACNLCHLDKSIDWTINWLARWYRLDRHRSYDAEAMKQTYADREAPVGLGWLKSPHEPTRLVAVDALARQQAYWALPEMLAALDDPYLMNRKFARIALEQWLGVKLADHGYQYFMTPEERKQPVAAVKTALLERFAREIQNSRPAE